MTHLTHPLMRSIRSITSLVLVGSVLTTTLLLTGCQTPSQSSSVYRGNQSLREQSVRFGTVESIRNVVIDNQDQHEIGTLAGAGVGGLLGSQLGKGRGQIVGAVAGAIAGGVAGQAVQGNLQKKHGVAITVKLDRTGDYVEITQEGDDGIRMGDRVRIVSDRGTSRVVR
jgi:outer membrane lipoprotein SlyB